MSPDDSDPAGQWRYVAGWYAERANRPGGEWLAPMAGLAAWVAEQPFAAPVLPGKSVYTLTVHLRPGYNPGEPFFSCGVGEDGMFEYELMTAAGPEGFRREVPAEQAREAFVEFVELLYCEAGRIDRLTGR